MNKLLAIGAIILAPTFAFADGSFSCPSTGYAGTSEVKSTSSSPTNAMSHALSLASRDVTKICREKVKRSTTILTSSNVNVSILAVSDSNTKIAYQTAGAIGFCCFPPKVKATPTPAPTKTSTPTPTPTATPKPTATPTPNPTTGSAGNANFHIFLGSTRYQGDFFILPQNATQGSAGTEYHSVTGEVSVGLPAGEYKAEFRRLKLNDSGSPIGYDYYDLNFIIVANSSHDVNVQVVF